MSPSDFYFDSWQDNDFGPTTFFVIVSRAFYHEYRYLDDNVGALVDPILYPLGFDGAAGEYVFNGDAENGKQKLLELGFVQKKLVQ